MVGRALPEPTLPPQETAREEADSITELVAAGSNVVAVVADNAALGHALRKTSRVAGLIAAGAERVGAAPVVLIQVSEDVAHRVAEVRRFARSDAAIPVVVPDASAGAAAYNAGAFACMPSPVVPEELRELLRLALDSRAPQTHSPDLVDKFRTEARLASIGRISAGLTHELASPLGAALLNFEMVRDQVERLAGGRLESPLAGAMNDLGASLARIRSVVACLRPVLRAEPATLAPVALERAVDEVLSAASDALSGVHVEKLVEPLRALAEPALLGKGARA